MLQTLIRRPKTAEDIAQGARLAKMQKRDIGPADVASVLMSSKNWVNSSIPVGDVSFSSWWPMRGPGGGSASAKVFVVASSPREVVAAAALPPVAQ